LKGRPEGEEIKRMSDDCECESKKGKKKMKIEGKILFI